MFSSFPLLLISPGCFSKILLGVTACLGVFAELKASQRKGCQLLWTEMGVKAEPRKKRSQPWWLRHMAPVQGGSTEQKTQASGSLMHSRVTLNPLPTLGTSTASLGEQTLRLCAAISRTANLSPRAFSSFWHPGQLNSWWEESEQ